MNLTFQAYLLLVIVVAEFSMAVYMYSRGRRSDISISYSLFWFFAALWGLAEAMVILMVDGSSALTWTRIAVATTPLVAASFVYFTSVFPFKTSRSTIGKVTLIFFPAVLMSGLILITDYVVAGASLAIGYPTEYGPGYMFFGAVFIAYWVWGLVNIFQHYRRADGIHRWQLTMLTYGILVSSAIAIVLSLILPLAGVRFSNSLIGPMAPVVWLGFTTYLLRKK